MRRARAIFSLTAAIVILVAAPASAGLLFPTAIDMPAIREEYLAGKDTLAVFHLYYRLQQDPPPADRGDAYFLMGLALGRAGDPESAALAFRRAEDHLPLVADACAFLAAKSLEDAGRFADAIGAVTEGAARHPAAPFFDDAAAWRARLSSRAGRHEEAARRFVELSGDVANSIDHSRFGLAAAREYAAAGDRASAIARLRAVVTGGRADRYTLAALDELNALAGGADAPAWYRDLVTRLGAKFFKDGEYRHAQRALAARQQAAPGSFGIDDRYRLGMAAFSNHDNDAALAALRPIAQGAGSLADDAAYRIGKIETRLGDNAASRISFETVLRRFPGSGYGPAARYQIALLDLEDNNYSRAHEYLENRLRRPAGTQTEYLTWLHAWTALRAGKLAKADALLASMTRAFRRSSDLDRYHYWRAAVLDLRGRTREAIADWREINRRPRTYYGQRAGERLTAHGKIARAPDDGIDGGLIRPYGLPAIDPSRLPARLRKTAERAQYLASHGRMAEAARVAGEFPDASELESRDEQHLMARLWHSSGRYSETMRFVGASANGIYAHLRESAGDLRANYYALLYPLAYEHAVRYWAGRRGLPPGLVYAVIYNESAMKPHVVSPANAVGLMQIVPRTGAEIAGANGETFDEDVLYDPETNIRYGTWYLRAMLDRFEGCVPCAIASYNAGPDVVGKWFRNKKDLTPEIFIEEIPYRETNRYVKKVLSTRRFYESLYDLAPAGAQEGMPVADIDAAPADS
ncbi:transglycosylase SLT domain-containing protein [bacterium]|nr:transglycosylase SLT domain-containing protein [bacterium]